MFFLLSFPNQDFGRLIGHLKRLPEPAVRGRLILETKFIIRYKMNNESHLNHQGRVSSARAGNLMSDDALFQRRLFLDLPDFET